MIRYLLLFTIILAGTNCRKNDLEEKIATTRIREFLAQQNPIFQGQLNDTKFSWNFAWNDMQSISGYENGNGICDPADPVRVVLYGLTSNDGGQTRFWFYSPKYDASGEAGYKNIFSLGKKQLGDRLSDFYLAIQKEGVVYQTHMGHAYNEIEILKTEKFTDFVGKKLRVWLKINGQLVATGNQNNSITLKDGLLIAEFYGYIKD